MTINRKTPNSVTHPAGIDGDTYATEVNEEIEGLWKNATVPATISSGTNALVGTASPVFTALADGNGVVFSPLGGNTGAVTLNLDGLGAKDIKTADGSALTSGLLVTGTLYHIRYNGTHWRLTPDVPSLGSMIAGYTEKTAPVGNDLVGISDSEDTDASKRVKLSNLIEAVGGGVNVQVFDASGTWTKPSSGTYARVFGWGGGASGASVTGTTHGGGGGGGAYHEAFFLLSDLGATETVTVGAGGTAVTGSSHGVAGGNSSFGSHITFYGGGRGSSSGGGGGGGGANGAGSDSSSGTGGSGGTAWGGGDANSEYAGGNGGTGGSSNTGGGDAFFGGGGGGGGANAAASHGKDGGLSEYGGGGGGGGRDLDGNTQGQGGVSKFGGSGGAAGGSAGGTAGDGVAGSAPGGGGGASSDGTSGAGGAGRVVVIVF